MISTVIAVSSGEEAKLGGCIASVKNFADEIVVFDLRENKTKKLGSFPKTRVIAHSPVKYIEVVRNLMVDACREGWILVLDPDERITPGLAGKLAEILKSKAFEAVNLPRKNIFFGKWIKHSGWWPDRHVRFFKKGAVSWSETVHKYPAVSGKVLNLPEDERFALIHYGYDSLSEFLARQNRYSGVEAQNKILAGEKLSRLQLVWWPAREFLVRYVKHGGFLDGVPGFILSYLMGVYKLTVWVKIWERQNG